MRKGPKAFVVAVVVAMGIVTIIQWIGMLRPGETREDARLLLYEASLFQAELVAGYVGEAAIAADTGELNGLKQAAYSLDYTHERLVRGWGDGMPELRSAAAVVDWIGRLQIGGGRPLLPREADTFAALAPHMQELYDAYRTLVSDGGEVDAASAERIRQADAAVADLVEEAMR